MMMRHYPRTNTGTCAKCKRRFNSADRVTPVYIVQEVGPDPKDPRQMGAWLGDEFEVAHINCEDPQLNGSIIVRG